MFYAPFKMSDFCVTCSSSDCVTCILQVCSLKLNMNSLRNLQLISSSDVDASSWFDNLWKILFSDRVCVELCYKLSLKQSRFRDICCWKPNVFLMHFCRAVRNIWLHFSVWNCLKSAQRAWRCWAISRALRSWERGLLLRYDIVFLSEKPFL